MTFPHEILAQHVAVLGKTGSGKTSTAKLLIEQVVAEQARVCVLDPIKSDWWGLTSSADGRRPGLPFHILGGPRGHVPLHASAGKAIGEIVASGALPLSIVDMAEFEPGGQAKFFTEFAPTLLRKMRGVVYLVIEEAHLFAPKERSGIGAENLSIHWAKTLATAGRSKGIRLVLVTQRTQALHNALLGSCDTLIAHRLTAPADQEPVIKWLKANTTKAVLEQVTGSLASLKTGSGWLCSGEAKRFEVVSFPRIATYDNTATPTGDTDRREVKTAAVDQEKLRAIIGAAVEQAKADDPRELRKTIADLQRQLKAGSLKTAVSSPAPVAPTVIEKPVLSDAHLARLEKVLARGEALVARAAEMMTAPLTQIRAELQEVTASVRAVRQPSLPIAPHPRSVVGTHNLDSGFEVTFPRRTDAPALPHQLRQKHTAATDNGPSKMERAMLTVLAQAGKPLTKKQIRVRTGYRDSGPVSRAFARLMAQGWVFSVGHGLHITANGLVAVGDFAPLPTGSELRQKLSDGTVGGLSQMERRMLDALMSAYPDAVSKRQVRESCGYADSGPVSRAFAHLVALDYATQPSMGHLRAADELFEEA